MRKREGTGRLRILTAVALTILELVVLLAASAGAVFFFQPYGQRIWTAIALSACLALVLLMGHPRWGQFLPPFLRAGTRKARSRRLHTNVFIAALAFWLGLIAWSSLSAGGAMPRGKSDPRMIRFVTWNILHGTKQGAPWNQFGWPVRKGALERALRETAPDILCVQEALNEQVSDLATLLAGHGQIGVGRTDGRSAGEYCAIFFDRKRFEELDGGTFWLEEPTALPPQSTLFGPKRICTWVRLRERQNGRFIRVYNTHLYLTESARLAAARIILARIDEGDPADAVLVAGDFNAPPKTPSRLLFEKAGLMSSDELIGNAPGASTYQFYGIRLKSLDDVLVNRGWHVESRHVLDVKPGNTFPSDHFGVMCDLMLKIDAR
jgi:endonuclease/exonuclease/phosphatase family metal-dependent hydrolase